MKYQCTWQIYANHFIARQTHLGMILKKIKLNFCDCNSR